MVYSDDELLVTIIDAIQDKKGIDIVDMDLSGIEYAVTDHFVICHGNSNTQVDAIANSVIYKVQENFEIKALHVEGFQNAQWILLDYAGIIVHVFQKEYRDFYNLEGLWADAEIRNIENF